MTQVSVLSNGVRVAVDPMPELESAALGVWADAGAMDEAPEENGVAHLLEHMAFKGTTRRTARAIAEEIESVGGYLNAATSYQRTGYYARVLKNDVPLAFDILADILTDPLFDEGELAKEREVVAQEIGEAWDSPDDAVMDILQAEVYRGQPLGRPILGSLETVRSHDRARLRSFMDRLYGPENLVVAAAGAVDPDRFLALVERHFAELKAPAPRPARAKPAYTGGARRDARDIEQIHLAVAFPGVSVRHEDYFATRVFAEAFGGGMASRLFQVIREERGLAYSVYAYADCYDDTGVVGAYAGADPAQAETILKLMRGELEKAAESFSEAEAARARAMLKSTLLMGLESPMNRIEAAAAHLFAYGRIVPPDELRARIEATTAADMRRCAGRALEAGPPSLAAVGPGDFARLAAAIGAPLSSS
ncbi:M16 family metallopeptidase [Amphiplicatus metriothermophilus]|uniref:Predicted Zn-dependent peptidase n=1 Tax=Amphiplicatus metriothermophilus TaxID=1519374 RepID=A0A239PPE6_9PROT|nr:pitrilysin family protein [Amphiplicatus metriothermophilus]MBB5518669.1 putative Zn-dependent peptidase [Amphiplicatus metriothermophilus]SNT72174.1 Predicted Zn-dependent peptidase [Amphiplicatus metriothermophilus]